jgi:hypothetical protein
MRRLTRRCPETNPKQDGFEEARGTLDKVPDSEAIRWIESLHG